ncbi:hypothetical protein [Desulfobacca acetoxidans]|nr:hypothetical protein [Desulfobacterales bacterium]
MNQLSLDYGVRPNTNLPEGMSPVWLTVRSQIWCGPRLMLEYPDGYRQIIIGWSATDSAADLRVFWTEATEGGPTVCLAIGGDGGVRLLADTGEHLSSEGLNLPPGEGRAFMALAESLIPEEVAAVIGPAPSPKPLLLL